MFRPILTLAAAIFALQFWVPARAQAPEPAFVARARVMVENNTPVPQRVTGTNVAPFQLLPHQQAELDMSATPPPAPGSVDNPAPVRFEYSVGQAPGPQCHGTIDMSLRTMGNLPNHYEVTNCVAHSLGLEGGDCNIVVSARTAFCQGGLAFSAR